MTAVKLAPAARGLLTSSTPAGREPKDVDVSEISAGHWLRNVNVPIQKIGPLETVSRRGFDALTRALSQTHPYRAALQERRGNAFFPLTRQCRMWGWSRTAMVPPKNVFNIPSRCPCSLIASRVCFYIFFFLLLLVVVGFQTRQNHVPGLAEWWATSAAPL